MAPYGTINNGKVCTILFHYLTCYHGHSLHMLSDLNSMVIWPSGHMTSNFLSLLTCRIHCFLSQSECRCAKMPHCNSTQISKPFKRHLWECLPLSRPRRTLIFGRQVTCGSYLCKFDLLSNHAHSCWEISNFVENFSHFGQLDETVVSEHVQRSKFSGCYAAETIGSVTRVMGPLLWVLSEHVQWLLCSLNNGISN